MTIIYAATEDQHLVATILPKLAQNNVNTVRLSVDFDGYWDSYPARSAVFTTSKSVRPYSVKMSASGDCLIPPEVLAEECKLYIVVEGVNSSTGAKKSSTRLTVKVLGGHPAVVISDPSPSVYQQLLTANAVLASRVSEMEAGGTVDGSEVIGIRTGADGTVYDTAGDAVREQINNVQQFVDNVDNLMDVNHLMGTVNKFNREDARIRDDVFVNHSGYVSSTGYSVTHPIYVKKGYSYKTLFIDSLGTNNNIAFTDINGTFISVEKGVIADGYITFTPSKSGYAVFNIGNRTATKEVFMVCIADEYPSEYVPFINPFDSSDENPLMGRTISFNGDSICAGDGFEGGYGKIIAERNSMTYENIAVGGGTITAETYSGNTARHWVCRSIDRMTSDVDFVVLEGGVNDAALEVPLGVLSNGYNATLDDTTFYGAFESMLKQTLARFAGKKIGYIAVHKMTSRFSSNYTATDSYYHAALRCCEKWGVPVCDLNISCPPFGHFTESGDAGLYALRQTYTKDGDGWHPTEEGYRRYYCDKIETWLRTL